MPSKPTTRWQISGYRFLVRRMEHALVRRDVRMLHDPMRSQTRAYAAGLILALVFLAGCGVLALLRPQDKIGNDKIFVDKVAGGVYVLLDGVMHPTLNLASARLAVGEPAKSAVVSSSVLGGRPRGQLLGIPGAPEALPVDQSANGRPWTVCDSLKLDGSSDRTTSVIAGNPETGAKAGPLDSDKALLLAGQEHTYLVYDGVRARIDMKSRPVLDALHITTEPRPASESLINAIPEVTPLVAPDIPQAGAAPNYPIGEHKIGDVLQLRTGNGQHYVVLADGLQEVSPLTADILRNTYSQTPGDSTIDQAAHSHIPVSNALPVQSYPTKPPTVVASTDRPVSCLSWQPIAAAGSASGNRARLVVLTGVAVPIADKAKLVPLAQADGSGPLADSVYLPPGQGYYAQATGIEPDSRRRDSLFYVADTGVRYGIPTAEDAKALGMPEKAEPVPWPLLGLLAPGPSLSRQKAMVAHDGVAPDPSPAPTPIAVSN